MLFRTSVQYGAATVNEARKPLFSKGNRILNIIPPTQAALLQHVRRTIIQAAYIWAQALQLHQEIPDPIH